MMSLLSGFEREGGEPDPTGGHYGLHDDGGGDAGRQVAPIVAQI